MSITKIDVEKKCGHDYSDFKYCPHCGKEL